MSKHNISLMIKCTRRLQAEWEGKYNLKELKKLGVENPRSGKMGPITFLSIVLFYAKFQSNHDLAQGFMKHAVWDVAREQSRNFSNLLSGLTGSGGQGLEKDILHHLHIFLMKYDDEYKEDYFSSLVIHSARGFFKIDFETGKVKDINLSIMPTYSSTCPLKLPVRPDQNWNATIRFSILSKLNSPNDLRRALVDIWIYDVDQQADPIRFKGVYCPRSSNDITMFLYSYQRANFTLGYLSMIDSIGSEISISIPENDLEIRAIAS